MNDVRAFGPAGPIANVGRRPAGGWLADRHILCTQHTVLGRRRAGSAYLHEHTQLVQKREPVLLGLRGGPSLVVLLPVPGCGSPTSIATRGRAAMPVRVTVGKEPVAETTHVRLHTGRERTGTTGRRDTGGPDSCSPVSLPRASLPLQGVARKAGQVPDTGRHVRIWR